MKSSREQGDDWAEQICSTLNRYLVKPMAVTKNSGAVHRDADMKNSWLAVDCKANAGGKFKKSMPFNELDKVTMQAHETNRIGVLIVERESGHHTVAMSVDDFEQLLTFVKT
jgi:hypothetical protein